MSLATSSLATMSPGTMSLGTTSLRTMSLRTISLGTMSFGTIVLRYNIPPCSSVPLQMVICKEDGSLDDQNQRDRGARIVANDHLDDPASSVLLRSFANGHLQREWFSGWPKSWKRWSTDSCKWSSGWSGLLCAPPFLCLSYISELQQNGTCWKSTKHI